MCFGLDEVDALEPGPDEVQIAVQAITIIFNDIDVETFRCMASDADQYLCSSASRRVSRPRMKASCRYQALFGNFSLVGACHAYTEDSLAFKRATGLNFLSHADGVRLHEELLRMIVAGTIRPIAGSTSSFSGATRDRRRDGVTCDDRSQRGDRRLTVPEAGGTTVGRCAAQDQLSWRTPCGVAGADAAQLPSGLKTGFHLRRWSERGIRTRDPHLGEVVVSVAVIGMRNRPSSFHTIYRVRCRSRALYYHPGPRTARCAGATPSSTSPFALAGRFQNRLLALGPEQWLPN